MGERRQRANNMATSAAPMNASAGEVEHITIPATPDAKRWSGWGTAMKPSYEPCVLARKPLDGTIASNVLAHGTGAINVDGCRVGTDGGTAGSNYAKTGLFGVGGKCEIAKLDAGRWPANVLLSHAPACVEVGTRTVKTASAVRRNVGHSTKHGASFGVQGSRDADMTEDQTFADENGEETIARYDCAPGCPIAELDKQSGTSTSPPVGSVCFGAGATDKYGWSKTDTSTRPSVSNGHGDSGGASRFFPTFCYTAKPATAERGDGLDNFFWRRVDDGHERIDRATWETLDEKDRSRGNIHTTVKPVEVMRWLVRLVTPPGGIVLDPFMGSGSTGCAAMDEGFRFVGVELSRDHVDISAARIAHVYASGSMKRKRRAEKMGSKIGRKKRRV